MSPSQTGTPTRLVIVESPAKARKIGSYLGEGYIVEASVGHIRDLPGGAAGVPATHKHLPWAKEGVDIENDFEPLYVINHDKKAKVSELRALLKDADELLLATDEDREGEAIAWHLLEVLKPKVPVKRMVFNEITEAAIQRAARETRDLDQHLIDAQETRRILDRLFGYRLSEVLWKKIKPKISAGRVQSAALRLVVERERERMRFVSAGYWDLTARCSGGFDARLVALDGRRIATGRDFGPDGLLTAGDEVLVLNESAARQLTTALAGRELSVVATKETPRRESPKAPFTTSTLQQDAGRRLKWGAALTMSIAQTLYENGYITYMRTDSTTLSQTAIDAARETARALYGADHVADKPRVYASKAKNAQEAHEAIRPAGEHFRTPGEVASELSRDQLALYELIWKRTVASQMADAAKVQMRVDLTVASADGRTAEFRATGTVVTFQGFLAAYEEARDDDGDEDARRLPPMAQGDAVGVEEYVPEDHSTSPPGRYTEPKLVAALEELGIGRPSTFAATIGTLMDRTYVFKRGSYLVPTFLGFAVCNLLETHFARLVDFEFTAQMEEDLDRIAQGDGSRVEWLRKFYYGHDGLPGLNELSLDLGAIDARAISSLPVGEGVVARTGRFGTYLERGEGDDLKRVNLPDTLTPGELTYEDAVELLNKPSGERYLGVHPETGRSVVAKEGPYGPYVSELLPEGAKRGEKPRNASLFKAMDLGEVDIDTAVALLDLPRVVGVDPNTGEEITAQNGPFGPYLRRGKEPRSLAAEEEIFTVTLDHALALFAQPRVRGRGAAKPPLADLGEDPNSGRRLVVKDGRFGPYVTDGETNASLGKGDDIRQMTIERGLELLAIRRAKLAQEEGQPTKRRATKKAASAGAAKKPAKKATAKKASAKKSAKKGAKKASTEKPATEVTAVDLTADEVRSHK